MEKVDKWSVIRWLSVWHGTKVQMQDCRMIYVGFLWDNPAYQVVLKCVGTSRVKTSGFDLRTGVQVHLLYYGDVL